MQHAPTRTLTGATAALALLLLLPWPVALAASGFAAEVPTPAVTEQPFEITVDRRQCGPNGVYVQILGAGGAGLDDGQGSPGYLVWVDGRARVLVDAGPGTALRFDEAGADFRDLVAIVFTHLHAHHSIDLPALIDGSAKVGRDETLPIYGPSGGTMTPGFNEWIDLTIGPTGAYRYLSDFLSSLSSGGYKVLPYEIDASGRSAWSNFRAKDVKLSAIPTDHGPVPALAWRVDVGDVAITFTGDTANRRQTIADFARGSQMLVASHAVPEFVRGSSRELYMPPSQIGKLALQADVDYVVLAHRTNRTRGRESASRRIIAQDFKGAILFANDLECWGI